MKNLLIKELRLAASPLSYFFIASALLSFIPGYPILLGAFFTTLGIFYSFQTTRENNDIAYSLLLPVAKSDVVRSKFAFTVCIELCSFCVMAAVTLIRMTVMKDAPAYVSNALMCANLTFLGFALLIFGLFNLCFVRGFFRTAWYFGKPFILYCVVSMLVIGIAETLHHLPGLGELNAFGFDHVGPQAAVFAAGLAAFALLTCAAVRGSVRSFEKTDL